MAAQGLLLPISLLIQNLQDVANLLKKFAGSNVLENSLGGKKIDAELTKVLHTLAQIELKAKNAFKTDADFSSLEREVNRVELSIERILGHVKDLKFDELKIPDSAKDQLAELNAQIQALKNNFNTFKASKKDLLLANVDFTGNIAKAFSKGEATSILSKTYDDMYKAIDEGVKRINTRLIGAKAEFELNSLLVTLNTAGKANFSAFGALSFVEEAFKKVENAGKMSKQQLLLSEYMNLNEQTGLFDSWKRGAIGMNGFYKRLAEEFKLDPSQLELIRKNVQEAAKEANRTAAEEWQKIANDHTEGAKVFGNGLSYADFKQSADTYAGQVKTRDASLGTVDTVLQLADAAAAAYRQLMLVLQEVASALTTLDAALRAPTSSLESLQEAIRGAITSTPQLSAAFDQAAQEIYNLRQAAEVGRQQLAQLDLTMSKLLGVSNFVNRYVGIYAIVRKVSTAIKNAFLNIKDLDKNITNIAVVTNMSQEDLWGKIGEYTQMAQQYGVATKDVYTVSQLFYQLGLQTAQVMSLTTETLKMAKISGMGYELAANAMTVAIRAFRIEMTDAQLVTDVYSALAAKFAVSSSEIANAMEKTASSAANVGMSLESTSAFISVMTQTTRESAQNIGSALKSIISRYGEMKASPTSLLNVDGEDVAFNKVDTALKSIGISIKDASGQFRDFDDVIMELAQKWDTLDNNTLRYIATVMAGNRQQSRFIALVSNYDELNRAMETANNAENASIVQVAKTMDSLESKAQQLKNAFSQVYLDLHIEDGLKGAYDWLTRIMKTIGKLGVLNGALPTLANIIGLGTGTKTLVNEAKEGVLAHRRNIEKRIELNDAEARKKAEDLNTLLEKTITKQVNVNVTDLNPVAVANTTATLMNDPAVNAAMTPALIGAILRSNPNMSEDLIRNNLYGALASGQLASPADQLAYLNKMNVPESVLEGDGGALEALNGLATAAQNATSGLETVGTSGTNASTGLDNAGRSGNEAGTGLLNAAQGAELASTAELTKASSAVEAAQADLNKAVEAREAARADLQKAQEAALAATADNEQAQSSSLLSASEKELMADKAASKLAELESARAAFEKARADAAAARSALSKAQADEEGAQSDRDEAEASHEAAAADREEASGGGNSGGKGGTSRSTLMKGIGIASGVARLAGTAITAAGAAHLDKSTDNVETSKILTGVGNGLSMAGTGASMGMAFGPWGAAIGAIGGFLLGGLGAIIDGAEMTLAEKIKLLKEEVETSKNESLKADAKATDLSSSIENIRALKKVMYNSADDMQAYKDAMNALADTYPELISSYDESGNAIINLADAENLLALTRLLAVNAAREANIALGNLVASQLQAVKELKSSIVQIGEGSSFSANAAYSVSGGGWHIKLGPEGDATTEIQGNKSIYGYGGVSAKANYKDMTAAILEAMTDDIRSEIGITATNIEDLTYPELVSVLLYAEQHKEGNKYTPHFNIGNSTLQMTDHLSSNVDWEAWVQPIIDSGGTPNADTNFRYKAEADRLSKIIANYKDIPELFGGKESIYDTEFGADWDKELGPTWELILTALTKVEEKIKVYDKKVAGLEALTSLSISTSRLYNTALLTDSLSSGDVTTLLSNGIYGLLFNQVLSSKVPTGYTNVLDWYNRGGDTFKNESLLIANDFIAWYESLTSARREILESMDFTEYRSADELMQKLGISKEDNAEIYNAFESLFVESNKANRKRILETIYATDEGTPILHRLNSDMKGLNKIGWYTDSSQEGKWLHNDGLSNYALDITDKIAFGEHIISLYSDYFTNELVEINKLAEDGYEVLAERRLLTLHGISEALDKIDDSKVLKDLLNTITNIDFSSYDSIIKAYTAIESYGKTNNIDVSSILAQLSYAKENLIFNVNTLAQELTTAVTNAAKEIDSILTTNKTGLTLDKAIESFTKLSAAFSEIDSFDDVFKYDAVLGKYVYTADGLLKAIAAKELELATLAELLSDTAKIYTERLTHTILGKLGNTWQESTLAGSVIARADWANNLWRDNGSYGFHEYETREDLERVLRDEYKINELDPVIQEIINTLEATGQALSVENVRKAYGANIDGVYTSAEGLMRDVGGLLSQLDQDLLPYYEDLAHDFMEISSDDAKYGLKTWDNYMAYLAEIAESNAENAEAALIMLDEYKANKKNQLYSAIDWGKLSLGTDYSGTNRLLVESLAKELGILVEDLDDEGNKIGQHWIEGYLGTWEEVMDKYIDETYTDEDAKKAAKAAVKGQIAKSKSDQISTAITEVLNGTGQVLSEATMALILNRADLTITDGIITAGSNFVNTALDLYNSYSSNLLSLADKNTAYSSILTKSFELSNQLITVLSAGASMDLATLSDTFTKFGLELGQYYDATAENIEDVWKGNEEKGIFGTFSGALETDIFGKTVIKDWNKFVTGLSSKIDLSQYTDTFEYQNAYSTYVDGLINLDTQLTNLIKGQYDAAFASMTRFKLLNVSLLNLEDRLQLAGGGAVAADDLLLLNDGILKIDNTVQYAHNAIKLFSNLSALSEEELYQRTGWTGADLAKNWKAAQTILTESYTAWGGISENLTALTDDNVSTLMEKGGLNLLELNTVFTKIGDNYVIRLDKYRDMLIKQLTGKTGEAGEKALSPAQLKKVNDTMAKATNAIANQLTGIDWEKILDGTATELDWTNFQNTMAASLKSLGLNLSDYYTWADGKTTLNLTQLRADIATTNSEVGKAFNKQLDTTIASMKQSALNEISTAMEYSTNGTFDVSEMLAFVQKFNELTNLNYSLDDLFEYNEYLDAFTLNESMMEDYFNALRAYLTQLGMSETAINEYIGAKRSELISSLLDITSFINGGYLTPTSKETLLLVQQMKMISEVLDESEETWVQEQLETLLAGGENAVKVLKALKGADNVTADEITAVYLAAATRLLTSIEAIGSEVGSIVDAYTAALFNQAGATVTDLGNGQYAITAIPNEGWGKKIAAAYMALYNSLKTSAGVTVSDLNNAYAKILESAEASQSNPVEALLNAASMTYTALGEILAKEGVKLEDVMADQAKYGILNLGAGKIRIIDFTKFAQEMNWDTNSEEYISAFKAYNDSLIELNHKTEKSIVEEVKTLGEAKIGDQLNLTVLWSKIEAGISARIAALNPKDFQQLGLLEAAKEEITEGYKKLLESYGATFNNGILELGANADILGIMGAIAQMAAENANLLPDQLAELADAILDFIKGIADAIKNGISGSLKNTEALLLLAWASAQGLGKLDFVLTTEGLKLSTASAIELYNTLKSIDALLASLVFDELNNSLKETNENYASVTSIMARIKELDTLIADEKTSDARKEQYKEELALAREILAVRSTSEDDSFNFMSNKIPAALNNPLNYAKNLTLAFLSFRDAFKVKKGGKTGFMDYEDWYNIVTEFNNMAAITGQEIKLGSLTLKGDLESSSKAIQAGASALTTVDTGELKVNLTDVGIGIKSGADALTSGVTEGIKGVAEALVKALDGLIAMLELIVSMEQLGDIDVEGNGIDLTDLFTVKMPDGSTEVNWDQFNPVYEAWRQDMLTKFLDYLDKGGANGTSEYIDLGRALEGIKIGGLDLIKIIKMEPKDLKNADKAVLLAYTAVLAAFSEAARSGNYDLNNISLSVMRVLAESGLTDTIQLDIGGVTYYISGSTMTVVDWESADTLEILKALATEKTKSEEKARTELSNWITAYGNGTLTGTTELKYVLAVKKNVVLDDKGNITSVTVGGHTYTNPEQFNSAMYALALEDSGISTTHELIIESSKQEGGMISVDVPMRKHTDVRVTSGDEGIQWYDGEYGPYSTKQQMLDEAWKRAAAADGTDVNDTKQKAQFLYAEYGVREAITAKVMSGETEVNVDADPGARKAIKDEINAAVEKEYEFNSTGNVEVELNNGMVVTLSGDAVATADGLNVDNTKVQAELAKMLGLDSGLIDNISTAISEAFGKADFGTTLGTAIASALTQSGIPLDNIKIIPENITMDQDHIELTATIAEASGTVATLKVKANTTQAEGAITDAEISAMLENVSIEVLINKDEAVKDLTAILDKANEVGAMRPQPIVTVADLASTILSSISLAITNLTSQTYTIKFAAEKTGTWPSSATGMARGNVGEAKAAGTLMGELGPELVVQNGHYFVAGLNGAEFVDLSADAIVFNHLQTELLLKNGMSSERGRAVTNERVAAAYAHGNVNGGPAMASAAAALAALKQLRAQWQSLAALSALDLAGKGGGGGGGGGNKQFIKDLEKWYNWLLKIAQLEKDINYEAEKRNRIASDWNANGHEYFNSLLNTINALKEELRTLADLTKSLNEYFKKRREEMNAKSNPFTSLYTFDEDGQLKYKDGALAQLSEISGRDPNTGKPNKTPEEQYKAILALKPEFAKYMKYDSSGNEIKSDDYAAMVQAFWDKIDADKEEMQSLHDSIEEGYKQQETLMHSLNETMLEMRDNQKDLELKIYDTIVDIRQRAIDDFLDTRDALEESNSKLLEGLNKALTKEQAKFQRDENDKDLRQKRDLLNILRRNGGSGTEISNLEKEIADLELTSYFDELQKLIDELQEAQDKELEKMDQLILIMTETLAFELKYGLLWDEVANLMQASPREIANFIAENNSEYWNKSPITSEEEMLKLLFMSEQWVDFRDVGMANLLASIDAVRDLLALREGNNSDVGSDSSSGDSDGGDSGGSGSGGEDSTPPPSKPSQQIKGWKVTVNGTSHEFKNKADAIAYANNAKAGYGASASAGYSMLSAEERKKKVDEYVNKMVQGPVAYYDKGGINDYTGWAKMHGTKNRPEAVLNAEQTSILRNKILGGGKKSLLNMLGTLQDALANTVDSSTYTTINRGSGDVTFDGTEVNMNFNEVANDYDARRAGEEAMKEMLRVARKTSVNALNRGR